MASLYTKSVLWLQILVRSRKTNLLTKSRSTSTLAPLQSRTLA
jgi:hypothetical protein